MAMEKEDLGLSLSLSFPSEVSSNTTAVAASRRAMQLNLMPSSVQPSASSSSSPAMAYQSTLASLQKTHWTDAFASSGTFLL